MAAKRIVQKMPAVSSVSAEPPSNNTLLANKLAAFEGWKQQTNKKYTIRLLLASSDKASLVETFLRSVRNLGDIERLHVSQVGSEGNEYVVYYDEFSQYSGALKALNALPKKLTQYSPYISTIPK